MCGKRLTFLRNHANKSEKAYSLNGMKTKEKNFRKLSPWYSSVSLLSQCQFITVEGPPWTKADARGFSAKLHFHPIYPSQLQKDKLNTRLSTPNHFRPSTPFLQQYKTLLSDSPVANTAINNAFHDQFLQTDTTYIPYSFIYAWGEEWNSCEYTNFVYTTLHNEFITIPLGTRCTSARFSLAISISFRWTDDGMLTWNETYKFLGFHQI